MGSEETTEQIIDIQKEANNELVFSYLTLRNYIGISGMLLPLILILTTSKGDGDVNIEPSISDYYYTSNGDVFVVLLSIVGVFLFTYKGYRPFERVLTIMAAIAAIGVAFSPTGSELGNSMSIHKLVTNPPEWFGMERHMIFASTFFLSIALITLIYFPKKNPLKVDVNPQAKAKRILVYRFCGWTIIASLAVLIVYFIGKFETDMPVIFIFETIMVEAFGLAWITKGQTLWPDGQHYMSKAITEVKTAVKKAASDKDAPAKTEPSIN